MMNISHAEKYLFDLNGFIVVKNVFESEEIAEMNEIIDRKAAQMRERPREVRNTRVGSALEGDGISGRRDLGGILEWGEKDSRLFRTVLAHNKLQPYFHEFLGKGYRMDHLPFVIAQSRGSEGFMLHGGTVDVSSGNYNPEIAYACINGRIFNHLLAVSVVLSDHNEGDGGFVVVPGSHKSNFAAPPEMVEGFGPGNEFIYQPITKVKC